MSRGLIDLVPLPSHRWIVATTLYPVPSEGYHTGIQPLFIALLEGRTVVTCCCLAHHATTQYAHSPYKSQTCFCHLSIARRPNTSPFTCTPPPAHHRVNCHSSHFSRSLSPYRSSLSFSLGPAPSCRCCFSGCCVYWFYNNSFTVLGRLRDKCSCGTTRNPSTFIPRAFLHDGCLVECRPALVFFFRQKQRQFTAAPSSLQCHTKYRNVYRCTCILINHGSHLSSRP